MLEHLEKSGGLGAIWPAIVNSIFAMKCLGYSDDHLALVSQLREIEKLVVYEEDKLYLQPCVSPVWDTLPGNYCTSRIRHTQHHIQHYKGQESGSSARKSGILVTGL